MNPKVDWYFTKAKKWQDEFLKLRTIIIDTGLTEELKWGVPCYTLAGSNIVLSKIQLAFVKYFWKDKTN